MAVQFNPETPEGDQGQHRGQDRDGRLVGHAVRRRRPPPSCDLELWFDATVIDDDRGPARPDRGRLLLHHPRQGDGRREVQGARCPVPVGRVHLRRRADQPQRDPRAVQSADGRPLRSRMSLGLHLPGHQVPGRRASPTAGAEAASGAGPDAADAGQAGRLRPAAGAARAASPATGRRSPPPTGSRTRACRRSARCCRRRASVPRRRCGSEVAEMPVIIGELEVVAAPPPSEPGPDGAQQPQPLTGARRRAHHRARPAAPRPPGGGLMTTAPALYAATPIGEGRRPSRGVAERLARRPRGDRDDRGAGDLRGQVPERRRPRAATPTTSSSTASCSTSAPRPSRSRPAAGRRRGHRLHRPRHRAARGVRPARRRDDHHARRGPAAGPADDAPHPHLRGHDRRRRRSSRSPPTTGCSSDVDLPGPTHRVIAQVDQSDLAFLRSRARRVGAEVWVADDTLHVARRTSRRQGRVVLSHRQNLREASIGADLAGSARRSPSAAGTRRPRRPSTCEADVAALASERAGGGTAGAELLRQAFGERPERVVHTVPLGPDEARRRRRGPLPGDGARASSPVRWSPTATRGSASAPRSSWPASGRGSPGSTTSSARSTSSTSPSGYRTHVHVERAELML